MRLFNLLAVPLATALLPTGVEPGSGLPDPGLVTPLAWSCNGCANCQWAYWHQTNFIPPMADYSPPVHQCQMDGDGCLGHGICGGEETPGADREELALSASFDAVREALLFGDVERLRRAMESAPATVRLYTPRNAVQVRGCQGQILAHFPLTPEQARVLSELPDRR